MEDILQKEIYLVSFPFSDYSTKKVRPILVLSNSNYNKKSQDTIICAITRKLDSKFGVRISKEDIVSGNILENSSIKVDNICFIDKNLLKKKIATLNNQKYSEVKKSLLDILN